MVLKSESPRDLVPEFFDKTAQSYDSIVNATTFGKDKCWKKEILKQIPQCNTILDLACGTGILTYQMAKQFPNSQITGVDVTESYLDVAKKKLMPHHKVLFVLQDAEKMNLAQKFDCIVSSYVPKYCNPDSLILSCMNHLAPNGKIILHDFVYPKNRLVAILWHAHFVMLGIAGFFMPQWRKVFAELPELIRLTRWLDDCDEAMARHGLQTKRQMLTWNCSAILTGIKKI